MRKMYIRIFSILILTLTILINVNAQSVASYTPTRTTGISYTSIAGTGLTPSATAAWRNGNTNTDDNLSAALPIGFTFYYNGVAYTQFSMSTNGYLTFNTGTSATGGSTTPYGYQNTQFSATSGTVATLAPFYDDQQTAANASTQTDLDATYKYLTTGSAGSRILTAEWINSQDFSSTSTSSFNYQVKLYEADGHIEFNYGTMTLSNSSTITTMSYSLGINAATISAAPTTAELLTLQTVNTNTFSNTASNALGGATPANMPTTNTRYTFTPPAAAVTAPSAGVTFTATGANAMTLNWTDGSTNETNFTIFRSTDNVTFTVVSSVVTTTKATTGTAYTSVQSGLSASTLYYWAVVANSEGVASSAVTGNNSTTAAPTYFWVGASGADWNTAANWNTIAAGGGSTRTSPSALDVLVIDGAGFVAGGSVQVSISADQSIGVLRVTSGTTASLISSTTTTRTITITGGAGDDLDIPATNTLNLNNATNAVAITFSGTGNTGNIAGSFSILNGASNSLNTTGGTGTVVTVANGGSIGNSIGIITSSAATLIFASGAAYNHFFTTTAGAIPLATWNSNSNMRISGYTSNTNLPTNLTSQTFGNAVWNCSGQTGSFNLAGSSITCAGLFTMSNTGTAELRLGTTTNGSIICAAYQQTGGIVNLASGSGIGTISVSGTFNHTGGTITETSTGSGIILFNGTASQQVNFSGTIANTISYRVSNNAGIDLQGTTMAVTTGAGLTITSNATTPISNGTVTYTGTTTLTYNSATGAQTITSTEFPSVNGPTNLVINNTATAPLNTVTLSASRSLPAAGVLTLTSGIFTLTGGSVFTLNNSATGAISGGSATTYVSGALARTLAASLAGGATYSFPIGKSAYKAFELVTPTTGATSPVIQAEVFDANGGGTAGTAIQSLATNRYWQSSVLSGNFASAAIRLTESGLGANNVVGLSTTTANGTYNGLGSNSVSTTITSNVANNLGFFLIGQKANLSGSLFAVGPTGPYAGYDASFTNLTAAISFLGSGIIANALTFEFQSDYTSAGETLPFTFNQVSSFLITIKPKAGVATSIIGANTTAIFDFNAGTKFTLNGVNSGGASLLVRNTNSGNVVSIRNDASNVTVQNTTLEGTTSSTVVSIGSFTSVGNSNISILNNVIRDRTDATAVPTTLINCNSGSTTTTNSTINITGNSLINFTTSGIAISNSTAVTLSNNDISENAARTTGLTGISFASLGTNTVSGNSIHDLNTSSTVTGMLFADARSTTVSKNRIYSIPSTSGSTSALIGIQYSGASGATPSVTLTNNFISIIPSFTNAQVIRGIYDFGFSGNTFAAHYNTVYIGGTGSGTASSWALVRGTSAPTTFSASDNIAFNNRTGGTGNNFAGGDESANTGTFVSNYNLFVGTGSTAANFMDYGTSGTGTAVSFAAYKAGPPTRDANSIGSTAAAYTAAATVFTDLTPASTDLHIRRDRNCALIGTGNNTSVLLATDFDGDARSTTSPFATVPGADEFTSTFTSVTAGTDQSVCGTSTLLSGSAIPSGGTGGWTIVTGTGSFSPSAATATATVSALTLGLNIFKWTVSAGTCSGNANVNITAASQPIAGTLNPAGVQAAVCDGATVSATLTAGSGGAGTVADELEVSLSGGAFGAYTSGASISTTGQTSVAIRTRRTATGSGCAASGYNTTTWTVNPNYTITASSNANGTISPTGLTSVCQGANQSYIITPNGGYLISDVTVDGTPTTPLTTGTYAAGGTYAFNNVTGNHTISVTFAVACTNVSLSSAGATATPICANATTTLTYTGLAGTGASVTWYDGTGGTGNTYGTGTPSTAVGPGTYYAYATGDCGSPVEIQVIVGTTASTVITVPAAPTSQTVYINDPSPANLTLTATGASVSYQWFSNASNSNTGGTSVGAGNGGQTNTYTPPTNLLGTKYYYAEVTGTCGTATSSAVAVTITNTNTWKAGNATSNWSTAANWTGNAVPTGANDAAIPVGNTPYPALTASVAINNLIIDPTATVSLNGNTLTLNGTVTGTGTLSGSATSGLVTNATTTVRFTPGANTLKSLNVNAGTTTLGNALDITAGTALNTYGTVTVANGATLASNGNLNIKSNQFGTARVAAGATGGNYITGDVTVERYIPANSSKAWRLLSVPTKGTKTIKQTWQENQAPGANGLPGFGTQITANLATLAIIQAAGFDAFSQAGSAMSYNSGTQAWTYLTSTNSAPIETNKGYFLYIRGSRAVSPSNSAAPVDATVLRTTGTLYQGDNNTAISVAAGKFEPVGNTYASAIDFTSLSKTGTLTNSIYVWDSKLIVGGQLGAYQTFVGALGFTPATNGGSYPAGVPNTTIESGQAIMVGAPAGGGGTIKLVEAAKTTGNQLNPFRPAAQPAQFRTSLYKAGTVFADNNIVVFDNVYSNAADANDAVKIAHGGENLDIITDNKSLVVDARQPVTERDVIHYSLKNLQPQSYKLSFTTLNMNTAGLTAFVEDKYLHTTTEIDLNSASEYSFTVDANNTASAAADRLSVVFKKAGTLPVSETKPAITVSPNPVEGSVANLKFSNQAKGKYTISLLGTGGNRIFTTFAQHAGGNGTQLLNLPSGLARGTYQLEVVAPDQTKQVQTLFINTNK